jgi:hypothetical protein
LKTTLPLTVRPYYYRMELAVPAGQLPEPAEESLLQEIQRLQFTRARAGDLAAARQDAIAYLDARPVRDWFASHDMMSRRDEGVQWIQAMSADDLRVAARDLLVMNRVIATWAPKPRQTLVTAEPLVSSGAVNEQSARAQIAAVGLSTRTTSFPPHQDALPFVPLAETLSSGVSIVVSAIDAVFVSGISMTRFDQEFTADDLKLFQQYRPDRILVLSKPSSMDGARRLWDGFKGGSSGQGALPRGKVPVADLPALAVLKTILDLRLIDAGWWPDASVRLDAGEGAGLQIRAADEQRSQIMDWIQAIATAPLPQSYFEWVREVAVHHFDRIRADLQALTWEREPQRLVGDPGMVTPDDVQRVARSYF